MKLTAIAERSGKWWAVEVPEIDGLFTQAKRLDKVPYMVRDAAALLTGEPEDSFEIVVTVKMDGVLEQAVEAAVRAAALAAESQVQASALTRRAAHTLAEEGMTVREIGKLLSLSPQRAQQLLKSDPIVLEGHRYATSLWHHHINSDETKANFIAALGTTGEGLPGPSWLECSSVLSSFKKGENETGDWFVYKVEPSVEERSSPPQSTGMAGGQRPK
jgi:predicted RNase H-like HicB family nuclease